MGYLDNCFLTHCIYPSKFCTRRRILFDRTCLICKMVCLQDKRRVQVSVAMPCSWLSRCLSTSQDCHMQPLLGTFTTPRHLPILLSESDLPVLKNFLKHSFAALVLAPCCSDGIREAPNRRWKTRSIILACGQVLP